MTGAILNAAGIIIGSLVGQTVLKGKRLAVTTEAFFKLILGLMTIFYGLRLVWLSVNGPFWLILKQIVVAALAITVGKLLGQWLHFQKASNRLGHQAVRFIQNTRLDSPNRFSNGLNACTILFCAAPLGILGAVQDGLSGYFYPLAVKAVMDGLAMAGFVSLFGWGGMLAALPVFLFQAAIALSCNIYAEPFLRTHGLVDSVNMTGGLLVCTVGLVIFEFKKVELADFLPSLVVAPLITWLWR